MSQVLCLAFVKVIYRVFQLGCAIAFHLVFVVDRLVGDSDCRLFNRR